MNERQQSSLLHRLEIATADMSEAEVPETKPPAAQEKVVKGQYLPVLYQNGQPYQFSVNRNPQALYLDAEVVAEIAQNSDSDSFYVSIPNRDTEKSSVMARIWMSPDETHFEIKKFSLDANPQEYALEMSRWNSIKPIPLRNLVENHHPSPAQKI